jgi:hypothetical protein
MCQEKCHKGKNPKECTPEQIKKCHGNVKEHPCEDSEGKKKNEDK